MSYGMYGKEFPTFDDICHHKYVKRERIGDKWRYFYDTKITGNAYKRRAAFDNNVKNKTDRRINARREDYNTDSNNSIQADKAWKNAHDAYEKYSRNVDTQQNLKNARSALYRGNLHPKSEQYQNVLSSMGRRNTNNHSLHADHLRYVTKARQLENKKKLSNGLTLNQYKTKQYADKGIKVAAEVAASKAMKDYYTKSLAGRISKAGMDIKKIINTIKNPPEVKKYKDVKTGISYKEKTYKDANGKVKEVRTTMSGAPITEKQKKAAKERKTKATAQQLANLARIDSIQQKYGDAMRKSYNGQNINDVRKKNADSSKKKK